MKQYNAILIGNGTMGARHRARFETCGVQFLHVLDLADFAGKAIESVLCTCALEKIDFAIIASPATTHYVYAKYFLDRHIAVFVEKPIATDPLQAEELANLARENGTLLFIAQSECFNPIFLNFRKHFLQDLKKNKNVCLEFRREHRYSNRCRDVDVALDLLVHDLSIFFTLFEFNDVSALKFEQKNHSGEKDEASLYLHIEKGEYAGIFANFYVNRNSDKDIRTITVDFGRKGINPSSSYTVSLANYLPNGEIAHIPDSLDNEHKFFLKLLAGACCEWGYRLAQVSVNAVKMAVHCV